MPKTKLPDARWIALVVICLAQLMSIVDATIVNVALPSIQRALHFSGAELTWVVNGYLISFGSLLLFAGRLGDLVGRRRIFLAGVALFTVASAVCGLASDQTVLIAARFLQGVGGAGASSAIMAIITVEFPPRGTGSSSSTSRWGSPRSCWDGCGSPSGRASGSPGTSTWPARCSSPPR